MSLPCHIKGWLCACYAWYIPKVWWWDCEEQGEPLYACLHLHFISLLMGFHWFFYVILKWHHLVKVSEWNHEYYSCEHEQFQTVFLLIWVLTQVVETQECLKNLAHNLGYEWVDFSTKIELLKDKSNRVFNNSTKLFIFEIDNFKKLTQIQIQKGLFQLSLLQKILNN